MSDLKNDKGSAPRVISSYRERRERTERLLPFFWIGVMLLVIGAGYLIYWFLKPNPSPQALDGTGTPPLAEMATQPEPTSATLVLIPTSSQGQPGTQAPSQALAEPSVITYTVQQGDTLAGIANHFGVGLPTLQALNPKVTPEFLNVGDELSLPAPNGAVATTPQGTPQGTAGEPGIVEYQVVSGDTLAAIAARFGSSINAIVQENNLESPDQIREGQTLRIPVSASAPAAIPSSPPNPTADMTITPSPEG